MIWHIQCTGLWRHLSHTGHVWFPAYIWGKWLCCPVLVHRRLHDIHTSSWVCLVCFLIKKKCFYEMIACEWESRRHYQWAFVSRGWPGWGGWGMCSGRLFLRKLIGRILEPRHRGQIHARFLVIITRRAKHLLTGCVNRLYLGLQITHPAGLWQRPICALPVFLPFTEPIVYSRVGSGTDRSPSPPALLTDTLFAHTLAYAQWLCRISQDNKGLGKERQYKYWVWKFHFHMLQPRAMAERPGAIIQVPPVICLRYKNKSPSSVVGLCSIQVQTCRKPKYIWGGQNERDVVPACVVISNVIITGMIHFPLK